MSARTRDREFEDIERARQVLQAWAPLRRRRAIQLRWAAIAFVVVGIGGWALWDDAHGSPDDTRGVVQRVDKTATGSDLVVRATVWGRDQLVTIPAPKKCSCWHEGEDVEVWFSESGPPRIWNHDPSQPGSGILILGLPLLGAGTYAASRVTRRRGRHAAALAGLPGRRCTARWWGYSRGRRVVRAVTLGDERSHAPVVTSGQVPKVPANAPESVIAFGDPPAAMLLVDAAGHVVGLKPRGADFEERNRTRSIVELGIARESSDEQAAPELAIELTDNEATTIVAFRALTFLLAFVGLPLIFVLRLVSATAHFAPTMAAIVTLLVLLAVVTIGQARIVRRLGRRLGRGDLTPAERAGLTAALQRELHAAATRRIGGARARQVQVLATAPVLLALTASLALVLFQ